MSCDCFSRPSMSRQKHLFRLKSNLLPSVAQWVIRTKISSSKNVRHFTRASLQYRQYIWALTVFRGRFLGGIDKIFLNVHGCQCIRTKGTAPLRFCWSFTVCCGQSQIIHEHCVVGRLCNTAHSHMMIHAYSMFDFIDFIEIRRNYENPSKKCSLMQIYSWNVDILIFWKSLRKFILK